MFGQWLLHINLRSVSASLINVARICFTPATTAVIHLLKLTTSQPVLALGSSHFVLNSIYSTISEGQL